ncbi:hypothetical protein CSA56_13805 [candidate division KSB3 bacterium]|uniref:Protochlamydia outer membrane protein domain-containing protein n=1 Tax=candidate division KSB3 bacterium TaxID=2044937 RepID=A0A2G6KB21_9BACT|nr:MAG: hypothetical protein CSA56_13805 [candidate division KSB3 bacterium]
MPQQKWSVLLGFSLLFISTISWGGVTSHSGDIMLLRQGNEYFTVAFGVSTITESGDMTYSIQGSEDGGWKSSLEWPLENMWYAGGVGSVNFSRNFRLNIGIWKSLTDDAGTMKDSDWLYGYYGDTTAIYSETDTTVESVHIDANGRYDFMQNDSMTFGAILGYTYTKWDWTAGDGFQWTIDPLSYYYGSVTGRAITYKQELKIPYVGLGLSISPARTPLGFNLYALYSPIAKCDDRDDHILRSKLSQGETDGTFLSLGGEFLVKFATRWSVTGTLQYSAYDLEGTQEQYFYAGENAGRGSTGIDLEIEGSQAYFGLTIGYKF